MKDTTIIELEKIKLKKVCSPGFHIGLIGRVVGRYLVEELKAKSGGDVFSSFPASGYHD